MKGLQSEKKPDTESNFDLTELFLNKSESDKHLDSDVNHILLVDATNLLKKSLSSTDVNNLNYCKSDEHELHSELYMNDYNQIISPDDNIMSSPTDIYNWNEVFNVRPNYLYSQFDDYPVCDYFKLLDESYY
jgi:hypothetical protein